MDPEHGSETTQESLHEEAHLPSPTLWPLGFAIGIVVVLVGLVIDPTVVSSIGGVIAIVFAILWIRDASADLRGSSVAVEPERREATTEDEAAESTVLSERFPRSRFLEGATLGLGGVIGGIITVPVAGFAVLPAFLGQKQHKVDLGPLSEFPQDQWLIATFMTDPAEGEVSRRTAFIRNNGIFQNEPSFTIISNRCAHLGCPVQPNGPIGKTSDETTKNGQVRLIQAQPAGFGCPCHGGQYDTEGNRTAGPPVRALDRYDFEIDNGRLILLSTYSVGTVDGTGAQAKIHKYKVAGPGEHVNGPEQWFYPLQPPHH